MSKRAKGNLILIVFSLIMVLMAVYVTQKDSYTFHPSKQIVEIDEELAKEMLQNGTGILYFGRDGCFWCAQAKPVLEEALKEEHIQAYYIDTEKEGFQWASISPYLEEYFEDDHVILPLIVACSDGQVIAGHTGTLNVQKLGEELTPEQKIELRGIYKDLIKKLNKERTVK